MMQSLDHAPDSLDYTLDSLECTLDSLDSTMHPNMLDYRVLDKVEPWASAQINRSFCYSPSNNISLNN